MLQHLALGIVALRVVLSLASCLVILLRRCRCWLLILNCVGDGDVLRRRLIEEESTKGLRLPAPKLKLCHTSSQASTFVASLARTKY